jgi:hypothetical protein
LFGGEGSNTVHGGLPHWVDGLGADGAIAVNVQVTGALP